MRSVVLIFFITSPRITFEQAYGKAGVTDLGYSVWPTVDIW